MASVIHICSQENPNTDAIGKRSNTCKASSGRGLGSLYACVGRAVEKMVWQRQFGNFLCTPFIFYFLNK